MSRRIPCVLQCRLEYGAGQFHRARGAFIAELSFQLFGYASYVIPAILVVVGWHCFWCRVLDAPYTKVIGATLLVACVSSFLSLAFGGVDVAGKAFRTGGYLGEWLAGQLAEYLNRAGSTIVILTVLFLAIILSTQFSFGRLFTAIMGAGRSATARLAAGCANAGEPPPRSSAPRSDRQAHEEDGASRTGGKAVGVDGQAIPGDLAAARSRECRYGSAPDERKAAVDRRARVTMATPACRSRTPTRL